MTSTSTPGADPTSALTHYRVRVTLIRYVNVWAEDAKAAEECATDSLRDLHPDSIFAETLENPS